MPEFSFVTRRLPRDEIFPSHPRATPETPNRFDWAVFHPSHHLESHVKLTALKHPAVQIGIAAIAGIVFGLLVGEWAANLKFIGDIFIRLIQMAIVPLVMTSVIVATGSMGGHGTGKLAFRTFKWMIGFSIVAAALAVALSYLFQPGAGATFAGEIDPAFQDSASQAVGWQDTILGFFSTNIISSMSTATMVPIIIFSLLFGIALNRYIATSGNTQLLGVLESAQQVLLILIRLVMVVAPIGVFALLASLAGDVGFAVVTTALSYLGTTLLGVVILTVLFVAVVAIRTGLSPWKLPRKLAEQTAIAITTTSSAVTYPTVLKNTVEKVGVSEKVANFTLSVGLTMGSYGAVLNYTIVVLFLAQAGNVALSPAQVLLGMGLAILLNMGTITVPGGFPVVALFLAGTLGLPIEAVGLLIAVDWFTGIFRTFLNVNGDTLVAMLVANADDEIDRDVYNEVAAAPAAVEGVPAKA
jgi:Na+/H+-dicarboxylate symporter